MLRMQVYVSGPIITYTEHTERRSINQLSVICRRIALCGHIPLCPALMCAKFFRDPRFKDIEWYTKIADFYLDLANLMCFVHEPVSMLSRITEYERKKWQGLMLPEDVIVEYLTKI